MNHPARACLGVALAACLAGCTSSLCSPFSCSTDANQARPAPHLAVTTDAAALAARVRYMQENIPLDPPGLQASQAGGGPVPTLTLVAEVAPPSINGQVLQATTVTLADGRAVVSYNVQGEVYLGGIDVIDLGLAAGGGSGAKQAAVPQLVSQLLFNNADVHAVTLSGNTLYAAEASGDGSFATPALFEAIGLGAAGQLASPATTRIPLTSLAATSVLAERGNVYATAGDRNGALFVFDQGTLAQKASHDLHDPRWVDAEPGRVAVVQGTPGRLAVFRENDLTLENAFPFTGADLPESKSTVQIIGGRALIAAGSGGTQLLSLNTGMVKGSVPAPQVPGLAAARSVTNAASADGNLLFMSNGEAGVYVARAARRFNEGGSEDELQLSALGKLRFGNLQSANHVSYDAPCLIVAAGTGGLKIVRVDTQ